MRTLPLLLLSISPVFGAITNLQVIGTTNTQIVVRYTAPSTSACTIEISESSTYSPLAYDVDASLFSGANSDARTSGVTYGLERLVVFGKRTIERATSGIIYGRALQAATTHYGRITCGSDIGTFVANTKSIPFGDTHGDPLVPDPTVPGTQLFVTPSWTRNSTWIDPHTGALIKRVQQPGDNNIGQIITNGAFTSVVAPNTNWVNPDNARVSDGSNATYDGANCSATCDPLILSVALTDSSEIRLDFLTVSIIGSGSDATAANRQVKVCNVLAGTTTIDPECSPKIITLPQTTPSTVTSTTSGLVDTWRVAGARELRRVKIWGVDQQLRLAVWKANGTGTISIDRVVYNYTNSTTGNTGTGGSFNRCSTITRTDDDGPRYLCTSHNADNSGSLYSIHTVTGDARFLGAIYRVSNSGVIQDDFLWSTSDPNTFFGQGTADSDQYAITYSGAGTEVSAGTKASFTSVALHPNGKLLGPAVKDFYDAHASQWPNVMPFDASLFLCPILTSQGDYLIMGCKRGSQDSVAWIAVYQISTNSIVALNPQFASPISRWCGDHYHEPVGDVPVAMVYAGLLKDGGVGNGIYKSTLVGDITSATASVTVTSTCGGDSTCSNPGYATGEPVATIGEDFIQPIAAGDFLVIESECVRLLTKTDSTHWVIQRGLTGSLYPGCQAAASHTSGKTFNATCAPWTSTGAGYTGGHIPIWNFIDDPYGTDSTGTKSWPNQYLGHGAVRKNLLVSNKSVAVSAAGTNIISSVKDPTTDRNPSEAPFFGGKFAPGYGNAWQQHPSISHDNAPEAERQFFFDIRPLIGGNAFSKTTDTCSQSNPIYPASGGCAAKLMSGFTKVYQIAPTDGATANPDDLNPKHFALFGVAARNNLLREISGPGSALDDSAGKDYTLCYALLANECITGSSAGQVFAQIPSLTVPYCTGGEGYSGGNDVCIGDYMAHGEALVQFGFTRNREGMDPVFASNSAAIGSAWTRVLARIGLSHAHRQISAFSSGKPLANGKWILATDWLEAPYGRGMLALVKAVPIVKDSVNRSTFVPIRIEIGSRLPTGTDNVIVEFGYGEHGTASQFYCTARTELCLTVSSSINETTPFYWASESYSGLSCASGCTVTINAYPSRVVYYRIKYRNSSNTVIATGKTEVAVSP